MNYSKKTCQKIRRKIRSHIHIKARECLAYRRALGEGKKELLVGGVVLRKKRQVAQIVRQDDLVSITKFVTLEEYRKDSDDEKSLSDIAYDEFVLYDFSGEMTVCPSKDDKDIRIKSNLLNEGDVVYVIGQVIPLNCQEGYFIRPKAIFNEPELEFYQSIYSEYFKKLKDDTTSILSQPIVFDFDFALSCYRNSSEILNHFLHNRDQINDFDYQQLADAFYRFDMDDRMKGILRCLFLRSFKRMEGINPQELIEEIYPFLK